MDKEYAIDVLKKYIEFLSQNNFNVSKAYLFGSYANNNFHSDSDIDVALVLQNYNDSFNDFKKIMRFRRGFDLRIEPHIFNESDFEEGDPFINEIKKTGLKVV
jgi:predicted nucleotidyltransferase